MKKLIFFLISFILVSCTDIIDKPKNLLKEDQMAEIIAELATIDQLGMVTPNYNPDGQTRFLFKKAKVDPKSFTESYKYYIAKKKMPDIYDKAQEIIKEKDKKGKIYIEKKVAEQDSILKKEQEQIKKSQN